VKPCQLRASRPVDRAIRQNATRRDRKNSATHESVYIFSHGNRLALQFERAGVESLSHERVIPHEKQVAVHVGGGQVAGKDLFPGLFSGLGVERAGVYAFHLWRSLNEI